MTRLAIACAVLLAVASCAQAHVFLVYQKGIAENGLTIRNSQAADGDGRESVSGPCGGAGNFGQNAVTDIYAGTTMTVTISYNRNDHRSNNNVFRAAFGCGSLTQDDLRNDDYLLANSDPVPAPEGGFQTEGYDVTLTIPEDALGECTVSVQDQREWGGCIDLRVAPRPSQSPAPLPVGGPNGDGPGADGSEGGSSGSSNGGAIAASVLVSAGALAVVGYVYKRRSNASPAAASTARSNLPTNAAPAPTSTPNYAPPAFQTPPAHGGPQAARPPLPTRPYV